MAVGTKIVLVVVVAVVVVVVVVVVTVSVCGGLLEDGSGVDGVLQVLHDPVPCAAANMIPHSATSMVTSLYPLHQPRYPLRYRIITRGWQSST
jgi:ABC-type dipeptide/oligopeptide/nickel transport system permease subunit